MHDFPFSPEEIAQLRAHGIVLFADRVIFDAQPPMAADQLAAVQALCGGKIPSALIQLWQLTAGGRLAYDLSLKMNGHEEAISWTELFYNGSDGYRDLSGWIEHERELAEEAASERGEVWNGELGVLPFGGFEYCDRIYVVTDPNADDYGHVLAWKRGLPPAWRGCMHDDGLASIAPDLHAAFRALQLDEDPVESTDPYRAGLTLLEYLDDRQDNHGMPASLAEALIAFYRRATVDWRTPLAHGTLARQPALARRALHHAVDTDDAALVAQLAAAGINFGEVLSGSRIPTEQALVRGAYAAATALIQAGAPVDPDTFSSVSGPVPPELVTLLLDAGALPCAHAMAQCVANGMPESAQRIGAALARQGADVASAYRRAAEALSQSLEVDIAKVRKGRLSHYLGLEGLQAHVRRLREFSL